MPTVDRMGNEVRQGGLDRILVVAGILLVVTTSFVGTRSLDELFPPRDVAANVLEAQHDDGPCYVLRLPLGVTSDKDGRSGVALFEDGTALTAHASHQALRDGALGKFSHWGEHLYLTSTDGTDPRKNGRTYVAKVPLPLPSEALRVGVLAIGAGLLMALAGLLLGLIRRRNPLTHVVPALVVLTASGVWMAGSTEVLSPWFALRGSDSILENRSSTSAARASATPGNVTRLLKQDESVTFEAVGEPQVHDDTRRVTLEVDTAVVSRDGICTLEPSGPGMSSPLDPPLRVEDISEIILPLKVISGDTLIVELFSEKLGPTSAVEIQVNVTPAEGTQLVKIVSPLSFWVARQDEPLDRVQIRVPRTSRHTATVELNEVVFAGPGADFQHAPHGSGQLAIRHDLRSATWQSTAGRFSQNLDGTSGRLLKGSVAVLGRQPDRAVPYRVLLERPGAPPTELVRGEWKPGDAWIEARAELGPRIASEHLTFEALDIPAGSAVAWGGWRTVDTTRKPRRVLLLLLDTLRADAVGAYGSSNHTPNLDRLAQRGVLFENCYSQAYWTRPSMPSIMSGRYVSATGIYELGQALPNSYTTLPEAFAQAGFFTVADIANQNAGPASGLGQGWDRLTLFPKQGGSRTEDQVRNQVMPITPEFAEEDLLLYVHVMEAHGPYGPESEPDTQTQFAATEPVERDSSLDRPWVTSPSAEERRHWYSYDVENMDRGLGFLFDQLTDSWGADIGGATVAVASDHGEYLGEYGRWSHGWFKLVPEITHVPLIISSPALGGAGRTEPSFVENIDIAPTLLELAGASPALLGAIDGVSMVDLIQGRPSKSHSHSLAAVYENGTHQMSIFGEKAALIGDRQQLTGFIDEHGQLRDLPTASSTLRQPVVNGVLSDQLHRGFEALWSEYLSTRGAVRESLWADVDTSTTTIDPEALRQLEELGYLGG